MLWEICFTSSRLGLSPQINVLYILCNSCIRLVSVTVDVKIQNIHSHYSDRNVSISNMHLNRHSCRTEWKFIKEHKCLPKHPLKLAAQPYVKLLTESGPLTASSHFFNLDFQRCHYHSTHMSCTALLHG